MARSIIRKLHQRKFSSLGNPRPAAITVLWVTGLLSLASVWLALRMDNNTQDWETWIEIKSTARGEFERFKQWFGSNDYVIASWPDCTLWDPRLEAFTEYLRSNDSGRFIERAVNGRQAIDELCQSAASVTEPRARQMLAPMFFGDGDLTLTAIKLSQRGSRERLKAVQLIETAALASGVGDGELKLAGAAIANVEIDRQTNRSMWWSLPAAGVALLIAWLSIRSVRQTLVVMSLAAVAALFSLALVPATGGSFNALLVLMPMLVMTITLSSAIHLLGFYRLSLRKAHYNCSRQFAVQEMLYLGWRPASFAMLTSAIGAGSLATGQIPAVRQFGAFTAGSILIGLVLLLVVLPAALFLLAEQPRQIREKVLAKLPPSRDRSNTSTTIPLSSEAGPPSWHRKIGPIRIGLHNLATSHPHWVVAIALVLLTLGALGAWRLRTVLSAQALFSSGSRMIENSRWIEQRLVPSESIEIVIGFDTDLARAGTAASAAHPLPPFQQPPAGPTESAEAPSHVFTRQLRVLKALQIQLGKLPDVATAFSVINVVDAIPSLGDSVQETTQRAVFEATMQERVPQLLTSDLVAREGTTWHWRMTLGCAAENQVNYPQLTAECRRVIEELCDLLRESDRYSPFEYDLDYMVTGMKPIASQGHVSLFSDLQRSFLLALGMISLMMVVLLNSVHGGLIAMLPNIMPPLLLFGFLGWIRYPLDVGMILTASVGLGIAVDNTFHFLHRMRYVTRKTSSSRQGILAAFRDCSGPMLQTTAICCSSLALFAFAEFVPVRQFAIAIVVMLLLAVLADLLLLPALASLRQRRLLL